MSDYKTEVIILKSWKSKEYDRIYSVFSREYGKKIVVGIGTRKPNAKLSSGLEPFTRSDIFLIKCRSLDRIKGVIVLRNYSNLKSDLDNLINIKKTVNILEKLLGDGEPNEKIFIALKEYFKLANQFSKEKNKAEEKNNYLERTLLLAQMSLFWKIIYWSGYFPRFQHCAYCGKKLKEKEKYNFILGRGINCGCQSWNSQVLKINLDKNIIKLIRFFISQDIKDVQKLKINDSNFQELRQFTKIILEQILERKVII